MKIYRFWVSLTSIDADSWKLLKSHLQTKNIFVSDEVEDKICVPSYILLDIINQVCHLFYATPPDNKYEFFHCDNLYHHLSYVDFWEWLVNGTLPDITIIELPNDNPPTIFSNPIIPDHYKSGDKMDVIDVCKILDLNFNRGNVLKYIARAGKKDDELQDLNKALEYLKREIKYIENKK